jgi:hypothetical protein
VLSAVVALPYIVASSFCLVQPAAMIETSEPALPEQYLQITTSIFEQIGKAVHVDPRLMNPGSASCVIGGGCAAVYCGFELLSCPAGCNADDKLVTWTK